LILYGHHFFIDPTNFALGSNTRGPDVWMYVIDGLRDHTM